MGRGIVLTNTNCILAGDCVEQLKTLPDKIFDCCVTSPPYYGLRDYGVDGQIGLEETPEAYIERLVNVFREVKRVLKDDGTLWLNIGDSYCGTGNKGDLKDPKYADGRNGQAVAINRDVAGCKHKDLIGIPWMLAFALRADGWYLRQDIIWHKPNPMPESVTDRCTKSHEYVFLLSKSPKYYYDNQAISEPTKTRDNINRDRDSTKLNNTPGRTRMAGLKTNNYERRNRRDVWTIPTKPVKEAHFATYSEKLVEPCILAGSREGGIVLDPFFGSGTTGIVAMRYGRRFVGCELNPEYIEIANRRTNNVQMSFV